MAQELWELRSALVYGSKHVGFFPTRDAAECEARKQIEAAGSVGRIEIVIEETRTVYFDKFADDE